MRLMRLLGAIPAFAAIFMMSPKSEAGILLEADWQGLSVRAEVASDFEMVRLEVEGRAYLMDGRSGQLYDLGRKKIHVVAGTRTDFGRQVQAFNLRRWSNGPTVAGHRSQYNVLQVDELVCGEVLDSGWMAPFMTTVVVALNAVQSVEPELAPVDRGACGAAAFKVYARNGWPLVVGWRDSEIFRTLNLRFDHHPDTQRMAIPALKKTGKVIR